MQRDKKTNETEATTKTNETEATTRTNETEAANDKIDISITPNNSGDNYTTTIRAGKTFVQTNRPLINLNLGRLSISIGE
jgi:hypothetical protein